MTYRTIEDNTDLSYLITMQWVLSRSKWVFQAEMPWMWEVPTSHLKAVIASRLCLKTQTLHENQKHPRVSKNQNLSFLVYNRHIVVITSFWVIGEGRVEWIAGVEIEDKAILFLLGDLHVLSLFKTEDACERCIVFFFFLSELLSSLGNRRRLRCSIGSLDPHHLSKWPLRLHCNFEVWEGVMSDSVSSREFNLNIKLFLNLDQAQLLRALVR